MRARATAGRSVRFGMRVRAVLVAVATIRNGATRARRRSALHLVSSDSERCTRARMP